MAESFYAGLFQNIKDKLSGANKDPKAPKDPKPKRAKESTQKAEPKSTAKRPANSKGIAIGRVLVDLTPETYRDAIRTRELKKLWVFIVAGSLAFAVLASSLIFVSSLPAKTDLDGALSANSQLQTALGKYKDVNQAVEEMGATQDKLNQAAGGEINWNTLIGAIQSALPEGTSVSSIGINAGAPNSDSGATILLGFVTKSPLGYADTLKSIQSAKGVSDVQIGGLSSGDGGYTFSATMKYDSSIRTNRFAPSTATGGN